MPRSDPAAPTGDTNSKREVYVRDRRLGVTRLVSVSSSEEQAIGNSRAPAVSATGRYVVFESLASNLVAGDTNGQDVFVRDRRLGVTRLVSVNSSEEQANGLSGFPAISANGRYVAFHSDASNLVSVDTDTFRDVFVRDRKLGVTKRVSVSSGERQANRDSVVPTITATGRYVAFSSDAFNLVPGDTNNRSDVFVRTGSSG
jgi:Tol biopolymer transport system component